MTRIFFTSLAISTAVAGMIAPAAAENEPAQHFEGFECEIDTAPLNLDYTLPDGLKSKLTYLSERLCTGEASKRNVKLTCTATLEGWADQGLGNRSASGFPCGIFVGICGLSPSFVDTTDSSLTVDSAGVASLLCFHKP
jgi:hypothetical protein